MADRLTRIEISITRRSRGRQARSAFLADTCGGTTTCGGSQSLIAKATGTRRADRVRRFGRRRDGRLSRPRVAWRSARSHRFWTSSAQAAWARYRARDPRLQRDVAIKSAHRRRSQRRRRLLTEARAAGALNHRTFWSLMHVGLYAARRSSCPSCSSATLRAVLSRARSASRARGRNSHSRSARAARSRCGHRHRDLKPENLFTCAR